MDIIDKVLEGLCAFPHRGSGSENESKAADFLENTLKESGAESTSEAFTCSKSYIFDIWWHIIFLISALALFPFNPVIASIAYLIVTLLFLFNLDFYSTFFTSLPPRIRSRNVIGKNQNKSDSNSKIRLLITAHYDSAPVSELYKSSKVKNFRSSLYMNAIVLVLFSIYTLTIAFMDLPAYADAFRYFIILYLMIQAWVISHEYFAQGYTPGAADNASGTAAAIALAQSLWNDPVEGIEAEVILFGAEETGMKGSMAYVKNHAKELQSGNVYQLNFDNVGAGNCRYITRSGALTTINYKNALIDAADTCSKTEEFSAIKAGKWHTGDFDSLPFHRAGIPVMTISAQDDEGQIPFLHRPEDNLDNVDRDCIHKA
ncbi:MAG: M28 family peptidase, partial [Candidatus Marinimicrobia bacterium]|nr:M28 family peptidase [Candidatus Neomarinimicrobiota bacterium]